MIRIIVAVAATFGMWAFLQAYPIMHTQVGNLGVTWLTVISLGTGFAALSLGGSK